MDNQPIEQPPELTPDEEARYRREAGELFRDIEKRSLAGSRPSGLAPNLASDVAATPDEVAEQAVALLQEEGGSEPDPSTEPIRINGERRYVIPDDPGMKIERKSQKPAELDSDGSVPPERILSEAELSNILIEPKGTGTLEISPNGNDLGPSTGDATPKSTELKTTTANVDPGLTKRVLEGLRRTVQEREKAVTASRADMLSEGNSGPDVQTKPNLDAVRDSDDVISGPTTTNRGVSSGGLQSTTPESDYLN